MTSRKAREAFRHFIGGFLLQEGHECGAFPTDWVRESDKDDPTARFELPPAKLIEAWGPPLGNPHDLEVWSLAEVIRGAYWVPRLYRSRWMISKSAEKLDALERAIQKVRSTLADQLGPERWDDPVVAALLSGLDSASTAVREADLIGGRRSRKAAGPIPFKAIDPGALKKLKPEQVAFAFLRGWDLEVPLAVALLLALDVVEEEPGWERLIVNHDRRSSPQRVQPYLDVAVDTLQFCHSGITPVPPTVDRFLSYRRLFPGICADALEISVMIAKLGSGSDGEAPDSAAAEAKKLAELLFAVLDGCAPTTDRDRTFITTVKRILSLASAAYQATVRSEIDLLDLASSELHREEAALQVVARDVQRWRTRVASTFQIDERDVKVVIGDCLLQTILAEYGPAVAARIANRALLGLCVEEQTRVS